MEENYRGNQRSNMYNRAWFGNTVSDGKAWLTWEDIDTGLKVLYFDQTKT